jgi:hypothetical protein
MISVLLHRKNIPDAERKILDEYVAGTDMVSDDFQKTEPQDNTGLRDFRHFPQDTADYCPDESSSAASDSRDGAGAGASAAAAVVAEVTVLADEVAAVAAVADDI